MDTECFHFINLNLTIKYKRTQEVIFIKTLLFHFLLNHFLIYHLMINILIYANDVHVIVVI